MLRIHPDFRDLVSIFNSKNVRFLVLGGYAVNFHGHHRNTKDFDIWIAIDPANGERVSAALQEFGFAAAAVPASKLCQPGSVFAFGREPLGIDILTSPSALTFDDCYDRRVDAEIDGTQVPFLPLSDLRANKFASGRLQDLADLEKLPPA